METYEHSFLQHPTIERKTEMLDHYAKMDGTKTKMDEQYSALDSSYKYGDGKNADLYSGLGTLLGTVGGAFITAGTNKQIAQLQADIAKSQNDLSYQLGTERNKLEADIAAKRDALQALIAQQTLGVNAQLQGQAQTEKLKQRKTIILLIGGGVLLLGSLGLFLYLRKKRG
jgi:hypothetical protein